MGGQDRGAEEEKKKVRNTYIKKNLYVEAKKNKEGQTQWFKSVVFKVGTARVVRETAGNWREDKKKKRRKKNANK